MKIVAFSIRRPVTVTMLFVAIAVFGVVSYDRLALNLLPEISYPTLTVQTRLEGAAPAEVESLITKPIENAVSVVNNVVRVSSVSRPEVSEVMIEFSWKTSMDFASLDVREKLDLVQLPPEADKPVLLRFDPSTDPILRVSVVSSSGLASARYQAEEFVKADLESVNGVAAVRVSGGLEEEIYVEVQERKMATFGLSIEEVTSRLAQENINLTGGTLQDGESKYLVRTLNEFQRLEEMEEIILALRNGAPIHLRDVGRVTSGFKERNIITRLNGKESVEMAVFKAADANTVSVADGVQQRLGDLAVSYQGKRDSLQFQVVFDQSTFIRQSIDEVLNTAMLGGILAIVVLLLFLRSLKSTLIIGLSIPISIVATFFLMYAFRVSLNIMSLSGLALGIGMLVDNSIVVLESIFRYRSQGFSARDAANRGAGEVGQAVTASTLTTICVFVPIVFVEGVAGQLFADQALTVTFSLTASLVVAIMLIPMLSSLGGKESGRVTAPQSLSSAAPRFARPYLWLLDNALRHRLPAVLCALLLLGASIFTFRGVGTELIPEVSQGEFVIDFEVAPGTPLEETARRMAQAEELIQAQPDVENVYSIIGAGSQSAVSALQEKENIGQALVKLRKGLLHDKETEVMETLRTRLSRLAALEYRFSRPTLFSFKTPVEVIVQGYNLNALKANAEGLAQRLALISGLRDIRSSTEGGNPEVHIEFDRRKLAGYGLNINQAAGLIRNKVQGDVPTEFTQRDRKVDIRVRVREEDRGTLTDLRNLMLNTSTSNLPIHLVSVADVALAEGPTEIRRVGPQRAAVITASLSGRDLQSVVSDINQVLSEFSLPADFSAYVGGQSEERAVAFQSMRFAILLAVFLVYLVMASQFESLVQPFIIMFSIPFALVGVAAGLLLTGQVVNVVVLIGAVILAGIVVNNSIVLIDLTNHLCRAGKSRFEAVREACRVRLRPILMTTMTTVLGLLPMALSWGEGAELRVPLAVTVIGGLISSTLLTLILVPVLYTLVVREKRT